MLFWIKQILFKCRIQTTVIKHTHTYTNKTELIFILQWVVCLLDAPFLYIYFLLTWPNCWVNLSHTVGALKNWSPIVYPPFTCPSKERAHMTTPEQISFKWWNSSNTDMLESKQCVHLLAPLLDIHHMAKGMWTPSSHAHMWAFLKLLAQSWNSTLV